MTKDDKINPQSAIAVVGLPARAKVVKAYLYWGGAVLAVSAADTSVDLMLPSGKVRKIHADEVWSKLAGGLVFACRTDVTRWIRSDGLYRIKEMDLDPIRDERGGVGDVLGYWGLVIVYRIPTLSARSRVTIHDRMGQEESGVEEAEIKEGNLRSRIGPVLVVEKRPEDVLFHLKKGHYLAAIGKSPLFVLSYTYETGWNRITTAVQTAMYFFRPWVVRMNTALAVFLIGYALLINAVYLLLTLIAVRVTRGYLEESSRVTYPDFVGSNAALPVSILVSAYNEELVIRGTLAALLRLKYPEYEVIVVNDGSKDRTLETLKREYDLRELDEDMDAALPTHPIRGVYRSRVFPHLYVIDKENSGKADSLNAGINLSHCPLVCTVDADTILEEDALFQLALPMVKDPAVVGTTGMVRLRNGCTVKDGVIVKREVPKAFLPAMQVLEYIRAYSIGRIGWNMFNAHMIVSGTFSLYRKEVVIGLGGYHRYAIGEDVDLNMRIHKALLEAKQGYKILYVLTARCLTEAPADLKSLARQRNRWHRGLLATVRLHTRMLFNRRYGHLGMLAVPFYGLLELPAPLLEFFGYVVMPLLAFFNLLNVNYMLLLLGLVWVYGSGISFLAVLLDMKYFKFYDAKSYRRILFWLPFEAFGFHQMTVLWRMQGVVDELKQVHVRGMVWRSPERLQTA